MTLAPTPVAWTSRIRPPVPVLGITERQRDILGTVEGSDTGGEVVGLAGQQRVGEESLLDELGGLAGVLGTDGLDVVALDGRGVIVEGDDGVLLGLLSQGALDELEEGLGLLLSINDHVATEEPVTAVLRVALGNIEQLDIGGVAVHLVSEHRGVVVEIPLIEGETELAVELRRVTGPHSDIPS